MFKYYFKIAWRNFRRNKAFSLINISGLAIGISVCLVIFLITSHELNYDQFHPGKERIYRIVGSIKFKDEAPRQVGYIPSPLPMRIREQLTGFEQVAGFYNYYAKVTVPQAGNKAKEFEPMRDIPSPVIVAEASYFSIFPYQWLAGNAATALNEPFKVVLTESSARKYFDNEKADKLIGRIITYNDSLQLIVSGIVKDWKHNSDFAFTNFISFPTVRYSFLKNDIDMNSWGVWDYFSQAFVKLAPGVSPAQVEAQLPRFVKDNIKGEGNTLQLQPLTDLHFNENYKDGYSRKVHLPTLYGLMGIALFILLIAIVNFINLSTAQSIKRAKEIGIKKVLGSDRKSLRIQFFAETFMITTAAVILSVVLLNPVLSVFKAFIPEGVILHPFQESIWVFLLIVIVATTLLAGFYPARVLSSYLPAISLKGQGLPKGNHKNYLRKSLIVFQFAISLAFIIGTLTVGKQIHYMLHTDMGFDKDAIINLKPGREETPDKKILFAQKLKQIPGVTAVSIHAETPAAERHGGTSIKSIGSNGTNKEILSSFEFADQNYIPLYDIKIVAGRNVLPSDTLREFVINTNAVTALGFKKPEDAVGQLMQVGISGKKGPVVGVIEDFHSRSFHEPINPFFITTTIKSSRTISIKLATTGKQAGYVKPTVAAIEKLWKEFYPDKEYEMSFFDETIAAFYEKENKTAQLMNTAMVIAILISCMGLLGLISFITQQRTKEIGIRKVLGASIANIVLLISKDFLVLVLIALVIAAPVAYYFMHQWLEDFAYRTTISWWIFGVSCVAMLAIAFLTLSIKAIGSAMANPIKSLRTE
ncbi:ABC transporter permease [Terrimonas pollutisoli]|uniref:ABC transporter permease n=1 Tax=Terrimonas pollutisoli TaxID=3034147 RepID=UPI0023ECEDA3|nr:ABC transporter permease [Terrimonas sp. H1YJ31]